MENRGIANYKIELHTFGIRNSMDALQAMMDQSRAVIMSI